MKTQRLKIGTIVLLLIFAAGVPAYANKKDDAKKKIDSLNQQIKSFGEKGDLQSAISSAEEAAKVAREEVGADSVEYAKTLNNVANLYMYAEHPIAAERLYKDAILIETAHYDPNGLELADSYYNLALAYAVQNKFSEALKMMNRVHKIRTDKLGADHPNTQKAREMLTDLNAEFGKPR